MQNNTNKNSCLLYLLFIEFQNFHFIYISLAKIGFLQLKREFN